MGLVEVGGRLLAGTGFRLVVRMMVVMAGLVDRDRRVVDGVQQDVSVVWRGDCTGDAGRLLLLLLHVGGQRLQVERAGRHLVVMIRRVVQRRFGGGI